MAWLRHTKKLLILLFITLLPLCTACDLSGEIRQSTPPDRPVESEAEHFSQAGDSSISDAASGFVASTENNVGNASDEVVLNPETPGMTSSQENEFIEAGKEWQELFDSATAMERYLRSVLSDKDHGGISVFTGTLGDTLEDTINDIDAGVPRLIIYAINKAALNQAIQAYTGKPPKIILKDGQWSLEDMNNFAGTLKSIKLEPKETLLIYTSEESNRIAANISQEGEDHLRNEIETLMKSYNISGECVNIWTLGSTGENPST